MKNRRLLFSVLSAALVVGLVTTTVVRAEGDIMAGEVKAIPCMGCHAIPGYSNVYPTYHVPRVGGQQAEYIVAALKAYRDGERSHRTMHAQAATLSDQDMADIAAFFSAKRD
jgi:cytochrome c553